MQQNNKQTIGIVLGAAKVNDSLVSLFGNIPSVLIPINGKPIVFYLLEQMIGVGITTVYLSVGFQRQRVISLVEAKFAGKITLNFVDVDIKKKPGNALLHLINEVLKHRENAGCSLYINLADTLIDPLPDFDYSKDFICVSRDYDASEIWCVAKVEDDVFCEIYDKVEDKTGMHALTGIYHFANPEVFFELERQEDYEISDLLRFYQQIYSFSPVNVSGWYDFGHLGCYYKAKQHFLSVRFFNSFHFNDLYGTITKFSENQDKLRNEIVWALSLPKKLQVLMPRIVEYSIDANDTYVEMEYYGYPPLSELWVYGNIGYPIWKSIVDKLFDIVQGFRVFKGVITIEDYRSVYTDKTKERLGKAICENNDLRVLYQSKTVNINGQALMGWPLLQKKMAGVEEYLFNIEDHSIIHGDLCLSNILFDINTSVIRLIDPRGQWGSSHVYGDIKYDLAKLRHSVSGLYDFIVRDLFDIEYGEDHINISFPLVSTLHHELSLYLDNKIAEYYPIRKIKLIEGLLFLSMLPLHSDNNERQLAMFATGISLLNEVFGERGSISES